MNASCVTVRLFEESDLEACAVLFRETFARPPWSESWERPVVTARLSQIVRTPHFAGLVLEAERPDLVEADAAAAVSGENGGDKNRNQLLGFALGFAEPWPEGNHFYLKEMCVHPDHQRQGLGRRLMEALTGHIQAEGASRIYLLTSRGEAAEQFYSQAGFYPSPRMILMARRFQANPP